MVDGASSAGKGSYVVIKARQVGSEIRAIAQEPGAEIEVESSEHRLPKVWIHNAVKNQVLLVVVSGSRVNLVRIEISQLYGPCLCSS